MPSIYIAWNVYLKKTKKKKKHKKTRQHLFGPAERGSAERIHQPEMLLGLTSFAQGELTVLVVGEGQQEDCSAVGLWPLSGPGSWRPRAPSPVPALLPGAAPRMEPWDRNMVLTPVKTPGYMNPASDYTWEAPEKLATHHEGLAFLAAGNIRDQG